MPPWVYREVPTLVYMPSLPTVCRYPGYPEVRMAGAVHTAGLPVYTGRCDSFTLLAGFSTGVGRVLGDLQKGSKREKRGEMEQKPR